MSCLEAGLELTWIGVEQNASTTLSAATEKGTAKSPSSMYSEASMRKEQQEAGRCTTPPSPTSPSFAIGRVGCASTIAVFIFGVDPADALGSVADRTRTWTCSKSFFHGSLRSGEIPHKVLKKAPKTLIHTLSGDVANKKSAILGHC